MYGCVFLWVKEGVWETKGNGRLCHGVAGYGCLPPFFLEW